MHMLRSRSEPVAAADPAPEEPPPAATPDPEPPSPAAAPKPALLLQAAMGGGGGARDDAEPEKPKQLSAIERIRQMHTHARASDKPAIPTSPRALARYKRRQAKERRRRQIGRLDGLIDRASARPALDDDEIDAVIAFIDSDESGELDLKEFQAALRAVGKTAAGGASPAVARASGPISPELEAVAPLLRRVENELKTKMITTAALFAQFDWSGDGLLSRDEFRSGLQMLCSSDPDAERARRKIRREAALVEWRRVEASRDALWTWVSSSAGAMPAERLGEREFFARDVRTPATWEAVVAAAAGEFPDHLFAPGRAPTPPTNAERVEQGEAASTLQRAERCRAARQKVKRRKRHSTWRPPESPAKPVERQQVAVVTTWELPHDLGDTRFFSCRVGNRTRNGRRARPGVEVAPDDEDPALPEMGPL